RDDQPLELTQQPARVAVGGDNDRRSVRLGARAHSAELAELDAGCRCGGCKPPNETRGLQDAVGEMTDATGAAAGEWRVECLTPLGCESILTEQLDLREQLVAFLCIDSEPETANPSKSITGDCFEPVDGGLGRPPETCRAFPPDQFRGDVVRCGAAA